MNQKEFDGQVHREALDLLSNFDSKIKKDSMKGSWATSIEILVSRTSTAVINKVAQAYRDDGYAVIIRDDFQVDRDPDCPSRRPTKIITVNWGPNFQEAK